MQTREHKDKMSIEAKIVKHRQRQRTRGHDKNGGKGGGEEVKAEIDRERYPYRIQAVLSRPGKK